ncbi:neurofibromin-like isoform X2 [Oncorhynchus keta]|uniref:neurofibromin-like isoform X2 n=1 Tax=Oncorhynchus keta TaxID=8018 RepID=UPI00227D2B43|nr:neurofibromin-like isoform X2 [Oncorhynchus keta]XP_052323827.1 neurofibromin-like isoform X2 [Oncorhynchus keta]XP_052323828.1 neurofibromin-like isoform X2 [Oncorhynchus keta]XP_052323829.1 neurofibromin-like isoform X2 [Oncorhynchus keta]XP_052323830.1 neurofibromin-like isoform X2 [Oncorhynchus keta]XP_052362541.1 neurofibromin-like isoform X2 [Oncorhynchus keta]
MQYINVDCSKLKRLLQETVLKFKALKKPAQLAVINSLEKALLFNPTKSFSRGAGSQNADVDLMIDCFVSCFRINPHNNQHFKVCLASASPSTFHFVLVNSLHRIITNSDLDWWPKIDAVYCYSGELRLMFSDTLSRLMQGLHTHCNGFDLRLLFIGVPGRSCLPERTLVSPFSLGGIESHLVRQVYTNTKDLCKSQDGNKLFINP